MTKYNYATAAGTFDYFHKGHAHFLRDAFSLADTIYIAITSDEFAKSSRQISNIHPFHIRKRAVEDFLLENNLTKRAKIIEIHDIYGPTLEPSCPIQAIVVTTKTRYGADLINKLRQQKGLPALAILEVTLLKASDGNDLSSSRIRAHEIDMEGNIL